MENNLILVWMDAIGNTSFKYSVQGSPEAVAQYVEDMENTLDSQGNSLLRLADDGKTPLFFLPQRRTTRAGQVIETNPPETGHPLVRQTYPVRDSSGQPTGELRVRYMPLINPDTIREEKALMEVARENARRRKLVVSVASTQVAVDPNQANLQGKQPDKPARRQGLATAKKP